MTPVPTSDRIRARPRAVTRVPGASSWFVATCMVMISGSLAAVIYLQFDLSMAEAGWIGFAVLMIMVLAEFFSARNRERAAVEIQLAQIDELATRLAGDVKRIEARFGELEAAASRRIDDGIDAQMSTIHAELQVADDRFRAIEEEIALLRRASQPAPGGVSSADWDGGGLDGLDPGEAITLIQRAIDDNRIEIHLQPVVTLPQRRVRHYEALTRLRDDDGLIVLPGGYMPVAEAAGLMPLIDNILLLRCVQIARRMMQRTPHPAIFCNISSRSLVDADFFPKFIGYLEENRDLADVLVFELPQAVMEALGPIEQSGLDALAELGFRFSVDHVARLDIDGAAYAARRIRYVKIDAPVLLDPPPGGHIHVSDLARLLARYNIDLIAARVETEAELVDLLDYDIPMAQGYLFSPPRPVRSEILDDGAQPAYWSRAS